MNISFMGLGKLGLPLACCLAENNNKVYALDKNEYFINSLKEGKVPFYETDLEELFYKSKSNFKSFEKKYKKSIEQTDSAVILVNTQMGDYGYSSKIVETVLVEIAENLKELNKEYYTIILSSTVLPGIIKKELIPLVEKISGKKYGKGFGFAYVPDFVKLGNVIYDFKNPEFFLIGADNDRDYDLAYQVFHKIHCNDAKTFRLTLEEAEIAKVSLNAYIVSKISFANFLGHLCSKLDNVNVHNITRVIGNDKRISPYFFSSGAPYGGTCFPRDTAAFIKFAEDNGHSAKHIMFSEEVNDMVLNDLLEKAKKYKKVGILGLSFKPQSPVTVASPSCKLLEELNKNKIEVYGFDFNEATYDNIKDKFIKSDTVEECINNSDVIMIMHYDKRFKNYSYDGKDIIDIWGLMV